MLGKKLGRSQGFRLKFKSTVLQISVLSDILLSGLYSSENLSNSSLYIGLNVKFEEKKVAKFGLVFSSKGFSLFWLRAVIMPLPISPITKTNNNF